VKAIAAQAGCSDRTVHAATARFRADGWLDWREHWKEPMITRRRRAWLDAHGLPVPSPERLPNTYFIRDERAVGNTHGKFTLDRGVPKSLHQELPKRLLEGGEATAENVSFSNVEKNKTSSAGKPAAAESLSADQNKTQPAKPKPHLGSGRRKTAPPRPYSVHDVEAVMEAMTWTLARSRNPERDTRQAYWSDAVSVLRGCNGHPLADVMAYFRTMNARGKTERIKGYGWFVWAVERRFRAPYVPPAASVDVVNTPIDPPRETATCPTCDGYGIVWPHGQPAAWHKGSELVEFIERGALSCSCEVGQTIQPERAHRGEHAA
jgi:hypothetical protein